MQKLLHTMVFMAFTLLFALATAQQGTTIVSDLNGPMGLLVDDDGNLWVVDSGTGGEQVIDVTSPHTGQVMSATFGDTSQVIRIAPDGTQELIALLPSLNLGQEMVGGARLATLDGDIYATVGFWMEGSDADPGPVTASVVRLDGSEVVRVADLWAFERDHNPDDLVVESHPYGLTVGPDGMLWVADAGGNTLLRVDPETGDIELLAVFDGIESPLPNPNRRGAMESDPVPTGITVGADGTVYVGLLPGFPFIPGSGKVVTVTPEGQVSDHAPGLTMITDVQVGPDGNLYAVQIGVFTEEGPVPNSGAVIRIAHGEVTEVLGELSFPTAIAFNHRGDAFITVNGAGGPGGAVVQYEGLAGGNSN